MLFGRGRLPSLLYMILCRRIELIGSGSYGEVGTLSLFEERGKKEEGYRVREWMMEMKEKEG